QTTANAARHPHARFAYLVLGSTCAALVARGPAGFVHPRLLPAIAAAALLAFAFAASQRILAQTSAGLLLPCALVAAVLAGSPLPRVRLDATNFAEAYPGAAIRFSGSASTHG